MKKILYIAIYLFTCNSFIYSQVDRKQPPKPLAERAINFGKVESFTLNNGLKVIVVENHKLPVVRINMNLDILPVKEGDKMGYTEIFGNMLRAGTINHSKEELDEQIDYLGSDFYAGSTYLGVSSLKKQLSASMDMMKELLLEPSFSNQEELNKLKKQLKTSLEANEKNPDIISERVQNVLLYGKEDAWGEYETEETINNIILQDFKDYYNTYFKPNVAYLSFIGDITPKEAKDLAEKYFGFWKKGEVKQNAAPLKKNTSGVKIAFVDLPSITQSVIKIISLNNLKKTDKDYFPAILGNSILGEGMSGRLFKDLREKHGWTYGAYSDIQDDYKRLGNFIAYSNVRNEVTDSAVIAFIDNIREITTQAPSQEELTSKKAEYSGNFSLMLERPETTGLFIKTQFMENLSSDFYKNYLKNIDKITTDQIPLAMKRVIDPANIIILIIGKAEEILPSLEKLSYPIEYYDSFGNLVKKPESKSKRSVKNITAINVLNRYYRSVAGNKSNLESITSISFDGVMTMSQIPTPLEYTYKYENPNRMALSMSIMAQTIKQGFNGKEAFSNLGPVSEDLKSYKEAKGYFAELYYTKKDIILDGVVTIDGKEMYKIIVSKNNKRKDIYFDTETDLKVKEEEKKGGDIILTEYSDYKEFEGYKLPTKIISTSKEQKMVQNINTYQINPSLNDADFSL